MSAAGSATLGTVPGVLDGLITTSLAPDGSVLFRVRIGTGGDALGRDSLIEIILSPDHADTLAEIWRTRSGDPGHQSLAVPCCIGVRLRSPAPAGPGTTT
jgi:hypothetical protein